MQDGQSAQVHMYRCLSCALQVAVLVHGQVIHHANQWPCRKFAHINR